MDELGVGSDNGGDWKEFAKKLRRIYADAVRLAAARDSMPAAEHGLKLARLHGRIVDLGIGDWTNAHARRLAKRLHKYGEQLITFVEVEGVPPDNNHAEREIRPAVIMRKASHGNQSEAGAETRAVLMTVLRTLKKRGLDPLETVVEALRAYAASGKLPALPQKAGSGG